MRLLLDTSTLIWWDSGGKLTPDALHAIDAADVAYVSVVSAIEIAVSTSLGRMAPERTTSETVAGNGFEELPVSLEHTEMVKTLPLHHRDPFDRLLIAQAMIEKLTIVTRDHVFERYGVKTIAA